MEASLFDIGFASTLLGFTTLDGHVIKKLPASLAGM